MMEAEVNRWQLAYETVSTLMASMSESEANSSWIPVLLNYPINANELYTPLLSNLSGNRRSAGELTRSGQRRTPHIVCRSNDSRSSSLFVSQSGRIENYRQSQQNLSGNSFSAAQETRESANSTHDSRNLNHSHRTEVQSATSSSRTSRPTVRSPQQRCCRQNLPVNSFGDIFRPAVDGEHRNFQLHPTEIEHFRDRNMHTRSSTGRERAVPGRPGPLQTNSVLQNHQPNVSQRCYSYLQFGSIMPVQTSDNGNAASSNVCDLFHRLMKNFYTETLLWMYVNTLLHPGSRCILNRIRFLAAETGRSVQQATYDMLTGFLNGYQQSRLPLLFEIDRCLWAITNENFQQHSRSDVILQINPERGLHLRQLSLELGAVLNPRQMLRSFWTVVREVTLQTIVAPGANHRQFSQQFGHLVFGRHMNLSLDSTIAQGRFPAFNSSPNLAYLRHLIPPPPPPYPGFLLHFLAMLDQPTVPLEVPEVYNSDDFETYEALSELAELLGDAIPCGLADDDIQMLPVYLYQTTAGSGCSSANQDLCIICLSSYERGHRLRVLPCSHDYHDTCIDKWLRVKNSCPICRRHVNLNPNSTVY